jgi:D-threonate/D-erythronate kinase
MLDSPSIDGFLSSTHPTTSCSSVGWLERSETHRDSEREGSDRLRRMKPGLDTVVIADDLTGAADTGVQFGDDGSSVYLLPIETLSLERPWMASANTVCVYTNTRQSSAQTAADRVRLLARALPRLRPRWIYKKIDSCLRGNPGAEIDVLLDELGFDAALVAPALPAQGRTTIGGIHRVYGTPLAETEFANDPVTPVTQSAITGILASQSRYSIGRIDVGDYADPGQIQRAFQRERRRGCRLIACDAGEETHLDQVAELVVQSPGSLLPVGSAGLATSLVKHLSMAPMAVPPQSQAFERLLMVCGTASQVTRRQLDALLDRYPGVQSELEPKWLAAATDRDRRRYAADLLDTWAAGALALRMRPLPPRSPDASPSRAVAGLAALALEIVRANPLDGLFLCGGDTAEAFRSASGAEAIRLEREMLPGLVLGRWLGGTVDGLPVVTKAGAFGDEKTLIALYERLSGGTTS